MPWVSVVPPVLTILGFLKWPATVSAAIVIFGGATNLTLSMLHDNVAARPVPAATIKASLATPVIRVPDTPVVSPAAARAKLTALQDARRFAVAALSTTPTSADEQNPARMIASSGLVVRSKPMKASAAVGTIAKGESVEVRSKQGGWLLVSGAGGQTGWIFGKYLRPADG